MFSYFLNNSFLVVPTLYILKMPRQCSVILCKSLKQNVTLFKVPAADFHSWNEIIGRINGAYNKNKVTYVCAEHFSEDDLVATYSGPKDLVIKY